MSLVPKVSVVMSVYNTEVFLEKAILSILNQQFKDYEFIMVDDASTDNSFEVIEKWRRVDDRIRVLRNEDRLGLTKSLNRTIAYACGEWIARQDADDISNENRLRLQLERLRKVPEIGLIGTRYQAMDRNEIPLYEMLLPLGDDQIEKWLRTTNCFCHGSVIFSKKLFNQLGGYPEKYPFSQDYALWLRFSSMTQLENLPEILYSRRIHEKSISNMNPKRWETLQQLKLDEGIAKEKIKLERFIAEEYMSHGRFLFEMRHYRMALGSFLKGVFLFGIGSKSI